MKRFTDPIRSCLAAGHWVPALMSALALPDICAWLETPLEKNIGVRYKRWSKDWIEPLYAMRSNAGMTASDLYALRCAILHSGEPDLRDQKGAKPILDFFELVPPISGVVVQNSYSEGENTGRRLVVQIDILSTHICDAVDKWDRSVASNEAVQRQKLRLIGIDRAPKLRAEEAQLSILAAHLPSAGGTVEIAAEAASAEARGFANALAKLFKAAGWKVSSALMYNMVWRIPHGFQVATKRGEDGLKTAMIEALNTARIPFEYMEAPYEPVDPYGEKPPQPNLRLVVTSL